MKPAKFLYLKVMVVVVWVALVSSTPGPAAARQENPENPRVFVVHSYNPEYVWTKHINEGISEALRGLNVSFDYAYMDAKRHPDPQALRGAAKEILGRIEASGPQVVIAADDAVQAYLVEPYLKGRASPQVIFCGVNAPISTYGFPASNVSGVRERWHWRDGFQLLKTMIPKLQTIAVIMDDSESAGYVLDELQEELRENGPFALNLVGVVKVRTFQEWRKQLLFYQSKADALAPGLYHSLIDADTGVVVPPEQVSAWNFSVATKPVLGFTDFSMDHGQLAGVLESGHEQGYLAGSMVRELLETQVPAGRLPVRVNQKGIVFINLKTAEKLNIPIPYEIYEAAGVVVR